MLNSIKETRKLFTIEGVEDGQVNIKTSKFLLSLPEDKQVEVLTSHLKDLKRDYAKYASAGGQALEGKNDLERFNELTYTPTRAFTQLKMAYPTKWAENPFTNSIDIGRLALKQPSPIRLYWHPSY